MSDPSHNGLPIHLFLAGRPCLVVGGGKIALRKIRLLLDAGAQVALVSPDVCEELGELIGQGRIDHAARPFEDHDVDGATLVYAATNSRSANRHVLECCRADQVLCCCVDGNWSDGDFTTPAIARHGQLTLAVSSGGNDCRQSKMAKNSLARHLRMIESAHLVVVGTDHHHLSVEEREPFHLTGPRFEHAGFMLMQLWGIHEFMILNTCNRVEVIAVVSDETARNGILRDLLGFAPLKEEKHYLKTGQAAFEHLCLVTAGMLSQTPGENHVAAQMKEALEISKARGWAGGMVQEWISTALHVSKAIKHATAPLLHGCEIEDLALRYLEAQGRIDGNTTLLVLGSGMVGTGIVRNSLAKVGKVVWCYHANRPELPAEWRDRVFLLTFNELKNQITNADVIVSAADSPGHLLHLGHAPFFNQERPVTLIDLGMPRNIDPELGHLSADIALVDLDGLKYWHRRESADPTGILAQSRAVIAEHRNLYDKIANSFKGGNPPQ